MLSQAHYTILQIKPLCNLKAPALVYELAAVVFKRSFCVLCRVFSIRNRIHHRQAQITGRFNAVRNLLSVLVNSDIEWAVICHVGFTSSLERIRQLIKKAEAKASASLRQRRISKYYTVISI